MSDIDEIYQRMAVIRREPHTNVRESVAGAEAAADWGAYTWAFPWIALGAAAAAGYLIYTGSHQKGKTDSASLADGAAAAEPVVGARATVQKPSWSGRSLAARCLGHLVPRGRPCGPELHAALARTTIPDEDRGPDRSLAAGRGAKRLDRSRQAVGR